MCDVNVFGQNVCMFQVKKQSLNFLPHISKPTGFGILLVTLSLRKIYICLLEVRVSFDLTGVCSNLNDILGICTITAQGSRISNWMSSSTLDQL